MSLPGFLFKIFTGDIDALVVPAGFVIAVADGGTWKTKDEFGTIRTLTGLSEIVEDLSPQLGSDLDMNGNDVNVTDPGDIYIANQLTAMLQEVKTIADAAAIGAAPHWAFVTGISAVGANANMISSKGHNNAVAGFPAIRDGEIIGLSVGMNLGRTSGSLNMEALINGVVQNGAGEFVVIDVTNPNDNFLVLASPIAYNAGDVLDLRTATTSYSPTGDDASCVIWIRDT